MRVTNTVAGTETEVARYAYDPFGRRISKTVNNQTTYFIYTDEGLVAELNEGGDIEKAYGWELNNMYGTSPLWQAEVMNNKVNTAQFHTLITDHLGTPQMAINDQGNISWKAVSESFGKTLPSNQNQITMNLRFPGQYFDEETNSHYNYFRDYNPSTGRYLQKDPIGVYGGINVYLYVSANPLFWVDLFGLRPDINYSPNRPIPGRGGLTEYQYDERIPDNTDKIVIVGHSKPKAFGVYDPNGQNPKPVDAKYIANDIRKNDRWINGEKDILLYGCNAASGNDNITRDLSMELGTTVTGLDGYFVHMEYDDGTSALPSVRTVESSFLQDYINRMSRGESPKASDYAYWNTYDSLGNKINSEKADLITRDDALILCRSCFVPR